MRKIEELFENWEDFDVAQYYLACLLGLMDYDETWDEFRRVKGVFWTNNKIGNMLCNMLEKMVESKILEKNEDSEFRWNKALEAYWLRSELRKLPEA